MTVDLRNLALEIAASAGNDNLALAVQIGRVRFLSGFHYGSTGADMAAAEVATEALVAAILDEVIALREMAK